MTSPQRPNGPRDERGPLAWATAVNDNTEELAAALCRITAAVWALVAAIMLLFLAVQPSWNVAGATALTAAYAAVSGWIGFVKLANPDWGKGKGRDGSTE